MLPASRSETQPLRRLMITSANTRIPTKPRSQNGKNHGGWVSGIVQNAERNSQKQTNMEIGQACLALQECRKPVKRTIGREVRKKNYAPKQQF
jgi:hypothetical protein